MFPGRLQCQEVGHTFGLGHTSEDGSSQKTCMDYSTDQRSTAPNQHDMDELSSIYGHTDSYSTSAALSPLSGHSLRRSANG